MRKINFVNYKKNVLKYHSPIHSNNNIFIIFIFFQNLKFIIYVLFFNLKFIIYIYCYIIKESVKLCNFNKCQSLFTVDAVVNKP